MMKYFLLVFALIAISCVSKAQDKSNVATDCPYDLHEPDRVVKLPKVLNEISGIAFLGEDKLAGIQDEKGVVFFLSGITGEIDLELDFGENGDYEDIALAKSGPYVLRSDGVLFKITITKNNEPEIKQIKTPLGDDNDTEGLFLFRGATSIWIACKEDPGLKSDDDDDEEKVNEKRAIYSLDLDAPKNPISLLGMLDEEKVIELARKKYGDVKDDFKPSALAVHPGSGKLYVLSAKNRLMAIFNSDFSLNDVGRFKKEHAEKAEGITFDNNGGMYISTEGSPAQLLYFSPHDKK
jgi:uncharacterized protein YjiK